MSHNRVVRVHASFRNTEAVDSDGVSLGFGEGPVVVAAVTVDTE